MGWPAPAAASAGVGRPGRVGAESHNLRNMVLRRGDRVYGARLSGMTEQQAKCVFGFLSVVKCKVERQGKGPRA